MVVGVHWLRGGASPEKLSAQLAARGRDGKEDVELVGRLFEVDSKLREQMHALDAMRTERHVFQKQIKQTYLRVKQRKQRNATTSKDSAAADGGGANDVDTGDSAAELAAIAEIKAKAQALRQAIDVELKVVNTKTEERDRLLEQIPNPQLIKRTFSTPAAPTNAEDDSKASACVRVCDAVFAFVETKLDASPRPKQPSCRQVRAGLVPQLRQACAQRLTNCLTRPLAADGLGFCRISLPGDSSHHPVVTQATLEKEHRPNDAAARYETVCESIAGMHQNEWLLQANLPHRYVACSDAADDVMLYLTSLDAADHDLHVEVEYDLMMRALYACVRQLFLSPQVDPEKNGAQLTVELRVVQLEAKQLSQRAALSHRIEARIPGSRPGSRGKDWQVLAGVDHTTDFVSRELGIRTGQKKILQVNGGLAYIVQGFVDVAAITTMILLANTTSTTSSVVPDAAAGAATETTCPVEFQVHIPHALQSVLDGLEHVTLVEVSGVPTHAHYAHSLAPVPLPWPSAKAVLNGDNTGAAPWLLSLQVGDAEALAREPVASQVLNMFGSRADGQVDIAGLCDAMTVTDLVELELALQTNSYVGGAKPSAGDMTLLQVLRMVLADTSREKFLYGVQYPNLTRWLRHMEATTPQGQ